jgi:hypothetical protein
MVKFEVIVKFITFKLNFINFINFIITKSVFAFAIIFITTIDIIIIKRSFIL